MINPDDVEFLELSRGWKALVDADLYPELSKHKWSVTFNGNRVYARRKEPGVKKHIYLHHAILPKKLGLTVDHRNSETPFCVLDERRSNLRYATKQEQRLNSRKQPKSFGDYKGIQWSKGKWQASICINGEKTYLGRFQTQEEAAKAYDAAAVTLHGEFARPNFPNGKVQNGL